MEIDVLLPICNVSYKYIKKLFEQMLEGNALCTFQKGSLSRVLNYNFNSQELTRSKVRYDIYQWLGTVLQRRLKMDQRQIQRFFGFLKQTEDKYEESLLIQKFFEEFQILRISSKIKIFSKENGKTLLLKIVLKTGLKLNFPPVELFILWGKLKFKDGSLDKNL